MKILFPYMARWRAANWTRYHSILTELAEMGHEIIVLQAPKMLSNETNFQELDIKTGKNIFLMDIEIPKIFWDHKWPLDKLFKKGLYSIYCIRTVKKIILEKKIDLMLLYNIPQYFLSRLKGCQIVFDLADDYIDMLSIELGKFSNFFTLGLARKFLNKMIDNADHIFSVSHILREDYCKRAIVLPNGVSCEKAEYALNNPINLSLKKPVVGFIGSFEYFIDFQIMLEAAKKLPDITFLYVGYGRLWKDVADQIRDFNLSNIHLTGSVSHTDIFRYINEMDICLNLFNKMKVSHAACPMKLFEYMIMSKPVISTRLDELNNIGLENVLYADTVDELVSSINELVNNPLTCSKLGDIGKDRASKEFTWHRIAFQFLDAVSNN